MDHLHLEFTSGELVHFQVIIILGVKKEQKNTVGSALTTSSEEVSIGELTFLDGSLLNTSEEGSMIIEGIENDVTDVSVIANSFTHKVPIKIEDASGNQESYFLLVSDT